MSLTAPSISGKQSATEPVTLGAKVTVNWPRTGEYLFILHRATGEYSSIYITPHTQSSTIYHEDRLERINKDFFLQSHWKWTGEKQTLRTELSNQAKPKLPRSQAPRMSSSSSIMNSKCTCRPSLVLRGQFEGDQKNWKGMKHGALRP